MVELTSLWLPILLSGVGVFIVSALAWMVMPHHKGDYAKLPNEDAAMAAVRQLNIPPGLYFYPHMGDCKATKTDPVAKAKFEQGPHGMLQVYGPGFMKSMGRNMGLSFAWYAVTSVFVAYIGVQSLPAGSDFGSVFQITGTAAIMAYCFAGIPHAIWFGTPVRNIVACLIDGVVFGLLTGAMFAWLWPSAAAGSFLNISPSG